MLNRSSVIIAAQLVFAAFSPAAEATYITFVASNGNDANPCTIATAPCKTLSRAYSVTPTNGTIRVLTSLEGNLSIAKSVTIEGDGATIVGGIIINNTAAIVTLRGLALNGLKAVDNGIRIASAAAVHIEDCTVERYASDGIKLVATTPTKLFISDTISRVNSDGLYADASNAQVVIRNSAFDQNASSGVYLKVARASVTGSSASGNAGEGFILVSTRAKLTETMAENNSGEGFDVRTGIVAMNSAEAHANGAAGLHIQASGEAIIDDCLFYGTLVTAAAVGVFNQGALYSLGNNSVVDGYTGPAPSPATVY